ncbi:YbhB/YbcL family Raf kinase inhibitor-like protein, partial [Candidatus Margulisiibacteriota bacterium]
MELTSMAFINGSMIPSLYTCKGRNISPPLQWIDPPPGTKSFALIVEDPDAPSGLFVHWIVWDIPADQRSLKENKIGFSGTGGIQQGENDFGNTGYGGPCPPSGIHRYFFRLYALDTTFGDLGLSTTKQNLLSAMSGHVLAEAELMGLYKKQ